MLKVRFNCECIRECVALGIPRGTTFGGTVYIDESGNTTFVIELTCGGPLRWDQELFATYFKIVK